MATITMEIVLILRAKMVVSQGQDS
jgi:hypothetical protein